MAVSTRRREERREARLGRLLGAALEILADRGYYETSVDQVVASARTSKTAFYEFFDSKEDCVRELLAREGGALIHEVTSEAAQGAGHRDRLRRGIRAFVHSCAERRTLARVLVVESVGVSPRIEEVRRAAQDGDELYAAVDPVVFGRAVVGAVSEATGHFLAQPQADPEALAASLCRIFAP